MAAFTPIPSFAFNGTRWVKAAAAAAAPPGPEPLTLLTWNVWFGAFKQAARTAALLAEIDWRAPEVVALQEITLESLELVLAHPTIRARYHVSDIEGTTFERYGVLLLSRAPFAELALLPLPSQMGRRVVVGKLPSGLAVATVHLESTAPCAAARASQLGILQPALKRYAADFVLMGDMNFSPDAMIENAALEPELLDAWQALHPTRAGFTVDSQRNAMRRRFDSDPVGRRIDRVFAYGQRWKVESIALTGDQPIDQGQIFISDHFGLEAVLRPR